MGNNAPSVATSAYTVALPDRPRGVTQMLEAKLDETLDHLKSIDAQMCELRDERAACIEVLHETTTGLSEKCDAARRLIDASKVSSQNY